MAFQEQKPTFQGLNKIEDARLTLPLMTARGIV